MLKSSDSYADAVKGSYASEQENLSLGRILKGYVTGDWDGAQLERKAMAESPVSAGGVLVPTLLSARVIDYARANAVAFQAGAITVPMTSSNLKMARLTADIATGWYDENAAITEADATFDSVTFQAKKNAALVLISSELLEDADSIDTVVTQSLGKAMALSLDKAVVIGDGTNSSPVGIKNVSGVQTNGTTVGTPTDYTFLQNAIFALKGANFEPSAIVYHSRTAGTLAQLKTGVSATDVRQLPPPMEVAALPRLISNQLPTNLGSGTNESIAITGAFQNVAVGLRRNLLLEVSRDYAFNTDQVAIKVTWRGDVQVLHLAAFYLSTGIKA